MFFFLSKILAFLLHPFNWCFLLLLASLILRKKSIKRKLQWTTAIVFFLFSNTAFFQLVSTSWEGCFEKPTIHSNINYKIVVLGGYSCINEQSQEISFGPSSDRLLQALPLLYKNDSNKLILSGGSAEIYFDATPESDYLRNYLQSIKIKKDRIIIESQSRNTNENAINVASLLKETNNSEPVILVTSAFHMYRAQACFNKQGVKIIPYPTAPLKSLTPLKPADYLFPSLHTFDTWPILIKEWIGIMVYALRGYI